MDGAAGWGLLGDPAEVLLLAATGVETVGEALHDSDACTVHRCRLLQHPLSGPVALKRIKISNNAAFERFERERAVLQRAQHPCVVRYDTMNLYVHPFVTHVYWYTCICIRAYVQMHANGMTRTHTHTLEHAIV